MELPSNNKHFTRKKIMSAWKPKKYAVQAYLGGAMIQIPQIIVNLSINLILLFPCDSRENLFKGGN